MEIDVFKRVISDMGYYVEIDNKTEIVTISFNIMHNHFVSLKLDMILIEQANYDIVAETIKSINTSLKKHLEDLEERGKL